MAVDLYSAVNIISITIGFSFSYWSSCDRKRNHEQIIFSFNCDSKLFTHVLFFTYHSIWKLPIKVIQQLCKCQFNNSWSKCAAWAYPSSNTKRNVLKITLFVVNSAINESLRINPLWFSPIVWISSNCPSIDYDLAFGWYEITMYLTCLTTFSWKQKRNWRE